MSRVCARRLRYTSIFGTQRSAGYDALNRSPQAGARTRAPRRPCAARRDEPVKKIGFLSFGHWSASPHSQVRTAADALQQSIELAVAAEELGADGAYFRVHHFARQLGSPFPLLAAVGARTRRIEIGTAVIDMRYENPQYMAEDAGAADLIAGGRLQLGISRGSAEQVIDGWRYFGYAPAEGETDADMARRHSQAFLELLDGKGFAQPNPRPMFPNPPGLLRLEPHSEGLRDRIWWGSGSNATSKWAAQLGVNLQSSTLKNDEGGEPLHVQQRKQIEAYRAAWKEAGHRREPRVSVSRSIFALVSDRDRAYFGHDGQEQDQIGYINANTRAIFGRSYAAEPGALIRQLAADEAIAAADTLLLTVPNQLGVEYNAHVIGSILKLVAPELGWR
jgi:alkanesulfonate monooxygenase SsuD/methylene tetrahydromethanopterin reductase-like flavin-dependent oxidoreductase (luciferase family)